MALDPEQQQPISSVSRESSGEISPEREPLIKENHVPENYSVVAAILPFLFPALGGLLYGYEIGATSCATISLQEPMTLLSYYAVPFSAVAFIKWNFMTSGSLYGALFGSIVAFTIADVIGRRKELILAALLYLVGALVTALAPTYSVLIIGRVIYGVSVGLAMHAAPMYIAETAPSPIRGQLVSLKEFFIVLGMVGGYGIGSLTVNVHSGWRYMYATSVPLAVIMGIGMWWLPASPRWLLLRVIQGKGNVENQREAAIKSLCCLRGPAFVDSAAEQVNEILAELTFVGEDKEVTFGELFQGKCLKALIIGGGLVLFQQLIMTGVAVVVIDRLGRRPLLLGGVGGMRLTSCCCSCTAALCGLLPEIFPLKLRGRGLSLAVLVNFGANALVTFAFSPLKELLGAGILFCGFGVICVLSLVFIFFIVPETKGLTLEEIEAKCL
ncbi:sugar transporter-like protein [Arabidopsis thaliana]|uniref:Major facilitator superfamily protein n=1 Tax=Arabidopsis thaliana TaxID=3702 RepID=F4KFK7_ARATH|nr:Major facilitator superfamily protein [Arabidopsis thaliana]AED92371.1 Major facilitator superfamily protein [Arabidopsis thaliana]CAC01714.1 sugar transporter-like protein [Arabidopsis thaliana]|eukprot:NP_197203.1 Major facilitator superfamily protein [Arabidopsis thaliana]